MKAPERRRGRAAPTSFAPKKASGGGRKGCRKGADEGFGKAAEPRGTNELRAGEGLGGGGRKGCRKGLMKASEGRRSRAAPTSFAPVKAPGRGGRGRKESWQEERRVRGGAKLVGAGSCAAFPEDEPFGRSPDPPQAEKITATLLPGV